MITNLCATTLAVEWWFLQYPYLDGVPTFIEERPSLTDKWDRSLTCGWSRSSTDEEWESRSEYGVICDAVADIRNYWGV
jgi:hypothetical protein